MLVFTPSADDLGYQNQLKGVKSHQDDLRANEVKVIWLLNGGPAKVGADSLIKLEVKQMQKTFHVRTDVFTVIPVDQKGRLRLRETKPIFIFRILPMKLVCLFIPSEIHKWYLKLIKPMVERFEKRNNVLILLPSKSPHMMREIFKMKRTPSML